MEVTIDVGAAVLAVTAIIFSAYSWRRTAGLSAYADIDGLYLELLKLGIEYPRFTDFKLTTDYENQFLGDEILRYNSYAFISWNICETIHDQAGKSKKVLDTWRPVVVAENKLHRKWFDNPDNFHRFKQDFRAHISLNYEKGY